MSRACPARGRRDAASSSRCRCRSRPRAASPCRTRCASAAGGPRASCPAASSSASRSRSSSCTERDGRLELLALERVVGGGEDAEVVEPRVDLARHRVEVRDRLDLVAEEADPVGGLHVRRLDLDHVAADAEPAPAHDHVVALVVDVDQLAQDLLARLLLAHRQEQHELGVALRRADAVDARHGGHDDHVAAREQGGGGGVAEAVDVVVDRGVLLDVGVRRRQVGLGLVVVVVADEVLDGVVREVLAELVAELRGQRLVVGDHERRPVDALDHARHGVRLAGRGRAQKRLVAVAAVDALDQLGDRPRLVAGGLVGGGNLQVGHVLSLAGASVRSTAMPVPIPVIPPDPALQRRRDRAAAVAAARTSRR